MVNYNKIGWNSLEVHKCYSSDIIMHYDSSNSADIAVTIGFVETSYTVVEGEGSRRVDIEVRVRTGTIPPDRTVEVTFSTSDRTASGQLVHYT